MLTGPQKCISSIVVERFNASLVTHLWSFYFSVFELFRWVLRGMHFLLNPTNSVSISSEGGYVVSPCLDVQHVSCLKIKRDVVMHTRCQKSSRTLTHTIKSKLHVQCGPACLKKMHLLTLLWAIFLNSPTWLCDYFPSFPISRGSSKWSDLKTWTTWWRGCRGSWMNPLRSTWRRWQRRQRNCVRLPGVNLEFGGSRRRG